ncbi:MAG: FAD-dependent oxidoreductase, partial [Candidatus Thermoplasmatota archaeon]
VADRLVESSTLEKDGVELEVEDIDFPQIMEDIRSTRKKWQENQKKNISSTECLDYYETEGRFIDEYTLEMDEVTLRSDKIFIAAGARPLIPPIDGVEEVDYLTNESILKLETLPKELVIIGGGYVGVEYAHFMDKMGSEVTIIQRGDKIVKDQDDDISRYLRRKLSERVNIELNTEASGIQKDGTGYKVIGKTKDGDLQSFYGDEVMIAVGRRPNTDLLEPETTGVETTDRGYIKVDEYLRTSKENIWAFGDITGKAMFKHVANLEADIAWKNAKRDEKRSLDYQSVPSAVFTDPKIGSVGLTENEAKKDREVLVGKADYQDIIKGKITDKEGFAKAVVEQDSKKLLGFHIIGPEAPILLQEVVNVMAQGGAKDDITDGIHTFPTLSRLIPAALDDLEPVE